MLHLLPMGEYKYRITKHNIIVDLDGSKLALPRLAFASCITCRRFNHEISDKNLCEAYPEGIPTEIIKGSDRHLKSNGEDNGLFYEQV